MWVFSKELKAEEISDSLIIFTLFSVFLGGVTFFSGLTYSGNPYLLWNKNSYLFLVFIGFSLAVFRGYYFTAVLIILLSLLIFSRTLLVMYISLAIILVLDPKKLLKYLFIFLCSIILLGLLLYLLRHLTFVDFLIQRVEEATELAVALYEYYYNGAGIGVGKKVGDHQRFMLFVSNLDLLIGNFPYGTGMGLKNYLMHIDPKFYQYFVNGHVARAHNFYISYLAEMGVLFLFFIVLLFKIYSNIHAKILKAAMLSIFLGLAFNEYITSPYLWLFFGIAINKNFRFNKKGNTVGT
ncbi:O-antigen ligase family protein [Pseudoalteromonas sp. SCSIO_11900]|uniref:O-antigen ligase family protein n=1 Tax=Pseudoalteromonas sp. SCSIO_11900 TaxID=1461766 RepID=UPI00192C6546|nr:O-antigen ligase family protein [Pseudoalteromonas sp. SCSIO_11900]